MKETRKTCITGKLPPPVGTSEWETFSHRCICVDKTRMIKELAAAALRQIKRHSYRAELEAEGCGEIVSLGLAFRGKKAVLCKG